MGCASSSPVAEGGAPAGKPAASPTPATPGSAKASAQALLSGDVGSRMARALFALTEKRNAREAARIAASLESASGAGAVPVPRLHSSFARVILNFPRLRAVFASIGAVFREFDTDNSNTIDVEELRKCMVALGAPIGEHHAGANEKDDQVRQLFVYAHRDDSARPGAPLASLTFQEFLLCLAVSTVMHLFPNKDLAVDALSPEEQAARLAAAAARASAIEEADEEAAEEAAEAAAEGAGAGGGAGAGAGAGRAGSPGMLRTLSGRLGGAADSDTAAATQRELLDRGKMLVSAMQIVLECYVLFDKDGSGTIDKNEVLAMIDEASREGSARKKRGDSVNALLSRERWEELDWDADGNITFKEFVFAMFKWVGLDEEEN